MSNTLILKRSASPNAVPTDTQLTYGELAINYLDGNLFYKNYNDQVVTIASNKFVSVSGNITGGNLISSGLITTSSNIAGGNITISGVVSATGNITGNNVVAGNNLTAGNVISGGIVSSTGNIIGNNFLTFGQVSASGNVSGDYILGNASQMTGVVAFKTIAVPSYPNLVANTSGVLNIEAGPNVFISTDSANGTLFIDATNNAVGFARLGLKTGCISAVGSDDNGHLIISDLKKESVDFLGKVKEGKTGYSVILAGSPRKLFR